MATFDTHDPITVSIELPIGAVHLMATKRTDTVVVANPTDPSGELDVEAAEKARIELTDRTLVVKVPKSGGLSTYFGRGRMGSVDMTIELPEGSQVDITTGFADVRADGHLAEFKLHSGAGNVHLDETGPFDLATGAGSVTLNRATGKGSITAAGDMDIGSIVGDAEIKNMCGTTRLGEVSGRLRVKSANGDVLVNRAGSDVIVKAANGSIQIAEVVTGSTTLEASAGSLEVGIGHGRAAWVDARTRFGRVHNALEAAEGPGSSPDTVEVRARTSFGDISVHRSSPNRKGKE